MKSRWGILLTIALLAGCGTQGAPTSPAPKKPRPTPSASPVPMPSAMPPGTPEEAFAELDQSRKAFEAMPGYACEMSFKQKGPLKTSHGTYAIEGKHPRSVKIEVKSGGTAGAKIRWDGGTHCKLRAPGVLGAISIELPIDHERLISVRGWTLKDTDIVALYDMVTSRKNQVKSLGVTPAGPKYELSGGGLLKGVKKMIVVLDPKSKLLGSFEMWDSKEVVYRMQLKNIRAKKNVNLDF